MNGCDCYCDRDEAGRGVPSGDKRNVRYCFTCASACGGRDSCGGTVFSDANTGNGGRLTDVPNVDESVVNDVTQGGIMTEVRTDVKLVDVYNVNGANGKRRNGGVVVDKCTAVHCDNDTDRAGGVTIYECNFDGNVDIVKREFGEMDDVCNGLNVENSVNSMYADTMGMLVHILTIKK